MTQVLALATAVVLAVAFAIWVLAIEPRWVEVTQHDVAIPDLPAEWRGAHVVQLTDLHYGDPWSEYLFRRMVCTVNALDPDLIVLTGDYVLGELVDLQDCSLHLSRLRAKRGIFAVLGDKDLQPGQERPHFGMLEALHAASVQVLRNEGIVLPGGLGLAGIDPWTRRVTSGDLGAALATLPGAPHLLLAHAPEIAPKAAAAGVPVVLCGHTHGGQVVLPLFGALFGDTPLGRRSVSGWAAVGATRIYTARGLASHKSLRFRCRPEIAVFRLLESA